MTLKTIRRECKSHQENWIILKIYEWLGNFKLANHKAKEERK
ncbi:unnamed protein product [Paramecium octaurelia]|nr:unnamed protein product [Paramecium octaurelia]